MRPSVYQQLSEQPIVQKGMLESVVNTTSRSNRSSQPSLNLKQSKTPFKGLAQKSNWQDDTDTDMPPPLVQYKEADQDDMVSTQKKPLEKTQAPIIQRTQTKSLTTRVPPPRVPEPSPKLLVTNRDKKSPSDSELIKLNETMDKETSSLQVFYQKPNQLKDSGEDDQNLYSSDKLIETYLRNMNPQLTYSEIENLSEAMIERQIQKYSEEKITISSKIKQLKSETLGLQKNDIKAKYINQEVILQSDKLLLMDRAINLFKDKLTLRVQIQNQKILVNQLAQRVIRMETEFTDQIHQLKTYNATLPTERERQLEFTIQKQLKQLENEKKLREELENGVAVNIVTFQNLFHEAETAKQHIIDQLKSLKIKKDELNLQIRLMEEQTAAQQKIQNPKNDIVGPAKVGFSFQHNDKERHSFAVQNLHISQSSSSSKQQSGNQGSMGSHLSKFVQKNIQQQPNQQDSFTKSDKNSVLQGLNIVQEKQTSASALQNDGMILQRKNDSLATIKENDISSPSNEFENALNQLSISKNKSVKQ